MGQARARAFVEGRQVHCQFCAYHLFTRRDIKLSGTGLSLLGQDWKNKSATGLICGQCGYVQLFMAPRIRFETA
jgi:predicted nucleic-acid-binding Zn-ribbon protein